MTNDSKPMQRLIADSFACTECGQFAVVGTQLFRPYLGGLAINGPPQMRVEQTFTLCFSCGQRTSWGWVDGEWKPIEVMMSGFRASTPPHRPV